MSSFLTSRNLWPIAIMACFGVFITGLVVFIAYASGQRMDLVQEDYYEEEIRFQDQLDRLNRTAPLSAEVAITYDAARGLITITLPAAHTPAQVSGRIHFYRPSDAHLDHEIPLALNIHSRQEVDVRSLQAGWWKVRIRWGLNGEEYFCDQAVVIGPEDKPQISNLKS